MGTRARKTIGERLRRMVHRPAPNVAELTGDTYITKADAAALIACRVKKPHDTERTARDRYRKLIADHIQRGLLATNGGMLRVGELGRWARRQWPGKFDDMPASAVATISAAHAVAKTGRIYALVVPGNLADCQKEVYRLATRVRELEARIGELSPDAKRWRDCKATNRRSAKKLRRQRRR